MRKPLKNDPPVEKVAILWRHLIDRAPVSDLCDEHQLSPTLFYLWQKPFFENGPASAVSFSLGGRGSVRAGLRLGGMKRLGRSLALPSVANARE